MTMNPGGAISSDVDLDTLRQGHMAILPTKDSYGRHVVFFDGAHAVLSPRDSVVRLVIVRLALTTSILSIVLILTSIISIPHHYYNFSYEFGSI